MARHVASAILVSSLSLVVVSLLAGQAMSDSSPQEFGPPMASDSDPEVVSPGGQAPRFVEATAPTGAAERKRPVQVRLPSLGVDARVVPVGVAGSGEMQIPRDGDVVGWYRFGARPGDASGSAVLVGHRDTLDGGAGALFDLDDVAAGDLVLVTTRTGETLRYRVTALRSLPKQQLPAEQLFAREGRPRLTLITCGGAYLPEVGGYQDNLVVTATPQARP
jgi:LPXTG-site transpeptidase (sortase) family protein